MNQDGKLEQPTNMRASGSDNESATSAGGKITLTLCTSPADSSPYLHATIRFPSSYQAACTAAMKTFAAYIPSDVEAVSLRQVVQRKDGQFVWGIIPEDEWNVLLVRYGEEIGVFLPHILPETIPYRKPRKKLARFQYGTSSMVQVVKAVGCLKECELFRDVIQQEKMWIGCELFYDERMVGTEAQRQLYQNRVDEPGSRPTWRSLDDAETFNLLLDMHPQPMWIYIEHPGLLVDFQVENGHQA